MLKIGFTPHNPQCLQFFFVNPNKLSLTSWGYTKQKTQALEPFLPNFKDKLILDLGANSGYFSAMAALNGASVVINDINPLSIKAATNLFQYMNLPFRICSLDLLSNQFQPFRNYFDYCFFLTTCHSVWPVYHNFKDIFLRVNYYVKGGIFLDYTENCKSSPTYKDYTKESFERDLYSVYKDVKIVGKFGVYTESIIYYCKV